MREDDSGSTIVWALRGQGPPRILRLGSIPLASAIAGNGDYDGDGHADLLLRDDTTTAVWMQLQVDGAVVGGGTLATALSSDWELAGSGDFNRDGRDDILVRNANGWRLEVWFMNGPQIVSRASLGSPVSSSWKIVGIADFSGDKLADILWYDDATHQSVLSVWGSWLGIQKTAELFRSSSPGDVVAVGDADGNGLPDVVTRHSESGQMRVWFTQLEWGTPKATTSAGLDAGAFTPVGGPPEPLASFEVQGGSDYDGDGRMDLAVRDPAAGDLRVWLLDAATVRGEVRLTDPGPAWFFEGVGLETPATHR